MSLSSASQLGSIIGGLANSQSQMKEDIIPDEIDQALIITPQENLVVEKRVVVTKSTYSSTSFILDHPVQGNINSATLLIDGGYDLDLSDGLVAFYNFHGDATDSVGSNDGSVNGATLTTDKEGRYKNAYSFDGTTTYIDTLNQTPVTTSGTYTVAGWLKWNGAVGDGRTSQSVWLNGVGGSDRNGFTIQETGAWGFQSYNGSAYNGIRRNTSGDFPVGSWVHFVCVSSSGTKTVYINGVSSGATGNYYQITPVNTFVLSYHLENGTNGFGSFNGVIDSVGVWNRVLSATEISRLYMGGYVNDYPLKSGELVTVQKS